MFLYREIDGEYQLVKFISQHTAKVYLLFHFPKFTFLVCLNHQERKYRQSFECSKFFQVFVRISLNIKTSLCNTWKRIGLQIKHWLFSGLIVFQDTMAATGVPKLSWDGGPEARFSKAPESFRARKAIFRSSVSKNGEVYTPETSCMKETSLHL